MPNEVRQVPRKRVYIGPVPAAVCHRRRQTANEPKGFHRRGRLGEHGRCHAVIAVENRQGAVSVHSDQQYGAAHQTFLDGIADAA